MALRDWTDGRSTVSSSALARTEVLRAVRHLGQDVRARARQVLSGVDLITLDDGILDTATSLDSGVLRSLDAIHLTAALSPGDDLLAIVSPRRPDARRRPTPGPADPTSDLIGGGSPV